MERSPSPTEFYNAMGAPKPTPRQTSIINVLITEASNNRIALAYLQGAFPWRQLARALHRRGHCSGRLARYVNLHAERGR